MTETVTYPFRLENAFFTSIEFNRLPELPEKVHLQLVVEVKVHAEKFPDLLIALRIRTPEKQPLMLTLELVSIFKYVEELPEPDKSIISDFVNNKALYMLWPYMVQMIRNTSGQMGTTPIDIATPYEFVIPLELDKSEAAEKEE